jgi:hypothetical protein
MPIRKQNRGRTYPRGGSQGQSPGTPGHPEVTPPVKDCWKTVWYEGDYEMFPTLSGFYDTWDIHFDGKYTEKCECIPRGQQPTPPPNCYSTPPSPPPAGKRSEPQSGHFCCDSQELAFLNCTPQDPNKPMPGSGYGPGEEPPGYDPLLELCGCELSIDFEYNMTGVKGTEDMFTGAGFQTKACEALAEAVGTNHSLPDHGPGSHAGQTRPTGTWSPPFGGLCYDCTNQFVDM